MRVASGFIVVAMGMMAMGCDGKSAGAPSGLGPSRLPAFERDAGPIVTGAGNVLRDLGSGAELTTFSYNAVRNGAGDALGHFVYRFRAAEFSMIGRVTCATVAGNRACIGGVIES